MRLVASITSGTFVALVVAACSPSSSAGPGTNAAMKPETAVLTTPTVDAAAPSLATTPLLDASAFASDASASVTSTSTSGGTDFGACSADADCVAVKKNACCPHGELKAVASAHADDYKSSFKCGGKKPLCPMYLKLDNRVALCDSATQHCAMAAPDSIACGTTGGHSCPSGFHCSASNICTN